MGNTSTNKLEDPSASAAQTQTISITNQHLYLAGQSKNQSNTQQSQRTLESLEHSFTSSSNTQSHANLLKLSQPSITQQEDPEFNQKVSFFQSICCFCFEQQQQENEFISQRNSSIPLANSQLNNLKIIEEGLDETQSNHAEANSFDNQNPLRFQKKKEQENQNQKVQSNQQISSPKIGAQRLQFNIEIQSASISQSSNISTPQNNQKKNISIISQDQLLSSLFAGQIDQVIKFIQENDFDVNQDIEIKPLGTRLLHIACHRGFVSLAQYLINNQAEIDVQDEQGQTPLMFATMANQLDALFLLLQKGANVQIKNNSLETAINLADKYKMPHIVILLNKYMRRQSVYMLDST